MNLIKIFIDLCVFQAKPQDLPLSHALVLITGATTIITYVIAHQASGQGKGIVAFAIAQVVVFAFTIWVVLKIKKLPERFPQTISAIFGVSSLIQLVAWPVLSWLSKASGTPGAELPVLMIMGLSVWVLAVSVYVMKHALEVSLGQSLLITLGCQMLTLFLLFTLFGAPSA